MQVWMNVMRDLEALLPEPERLLDAWQEGGVTGLVVGPLQFDADKLLPTVIRVAGPQPATAAFDPDTEVYRTLGVEAPELPRPEPERRARLKRALDAATERGIEIRLMYADTGAGPGGAGHFLWDELTLRSRVARMVDTLQQFPQAAGALMDGPEWGYEIDARHMNHRSYIFHDLPDSLRPLCESMDYDFDAMSGARDRLFARLHRLTPRQVALAAGGGLLGALDLLGWDPDLISWLRFRSDSMTQYLRRLRDLLDRTCNRPVKLSIGPRTPAFGALTGMNLSDLTGIFDELHPKHYFWHRGFDGLVGTVYRYVEVLTEWNPTLSDADALTVVELLFGIRFPTAASVRNRSDLERALSPEFYAEVVSLETTRALAAVEDPARIVPWVDAGRCPHDGDPIPADGLARILDVSARAGLRRFIYHHQGNLTAGEWVVISERCGRRWDPRASWYQPSDQLIL